MTKPVLYAHKHGITTIDTDFMRPGFVASHLLVENQQAVFIDVGASTSIPLLLQTLRQMQIEPEAVQAVIVTHVHLDHAGAAGLLLQSLPNAKLIVHPRGARHMIDPSKLIAGATAVYGPETMQKLFGEIKPVPSERVIEAADEFVYTINGRELLFLETPGHALHHFCVYDSKSSSFFTGDAFGLSYREFDNHNGQFILPATTPVQFDPQAYHQTIDRLLTMKPQQMFLAHFACVNSVNKLAAYLHQHLDLYVELALSVKHQVDLVSAIAAGLRDLLVKQLNAHACQLSQQQVLKLLQVDIKLNAQGLAHWLKHQA